MMTEQQRREPHAKKFSLLKFAVGTAMGAIAIGVALLASAPASEGTTDAQTTSATASESAHGSHATAPDALHARRSNPSTRTAPRKLEPTTPVATSLTTSQDYAALKSHFAAMADAGDPEAKRHIAQIYDFCATYSRSPQQFEQQVEALARIEPRARVRIREVAALTEKRCAHLDAGTPISQELLALNWADAVASRDPVATLKIAAGQDDLEGVQLDHLLDRILPAADPETLFEVGAVLAANQGSLKYSEYSDPYLSQYAWQVVACRRGGEAMCGPNSSLMMSMCMNGSCTTGSLEQAIRALVPGADQARLNRQISEIERLTSNRNIP